jgi:hypothetical protein
MAHWEQWLEVEDRPKKTRKPDKNIFCRRNKNQGKYGPHIYEQEATSCKLCGHLRNKTNYLITKENEEDE